VSLPPGAQPSLAPLSTAVGEIYRYILEAPKDMALHEVRAVQDWVVKPALRIVPGIADVISFGGLIKEYQARIDPYALKRYGVTLDQTSQAVAANSANVGGGLLPRGDEALVVRGIGLYQSLDDLARTMSRRPAASRSMSATWRKSKSAIACARESSPRTPRTTWSKASW